jgi:hypothetical protein
LLLGVEFLEGLGWAIVELCLKEVWQGGNGDGGDAAGVPDFGGGWVEFLDAGVLVHDACDEQV